MAPARRHTVGPSLAPTLGLTSTTVHACPKCHTKVSTGATDCAKCGHVFTPGVDSPRVSPWWAIEPICYAVGSIWLLLASRSAATTGSLVLPSKRDSWVIEASSLEPWQWWALLATVAIAGILAAARAVAITFRRLRNS
jgi:ribosomal protein L40E